MRLKDVLKLTQLEYEKSNIVKYRATNPEDPEISICSAVEYYQVKNLSKLSELFSLMCQSSWHEEHVKGKGR